MPTVSQHYGHHAAPRTDKSVLATRQTAAPWCSWYQVVRTRRLCSLWHAHQSWIFWMGVV